ncbi:hypothetical protein [Virgisporangium aurantiacum]|uniref:CARDB domain-containing protein n=1 Tax=Virgisporangium aurantiacum TaxID=175570 RepID=A0A8J3ZLF0_9ACTN|nr:hypothetical protein [Virgisporangium aurantiacum]GIJ63636.1 hypothetical protein Vau01_111520 [Virgisporangium aurantiacum]
MRGSVAVILVALVAASAGCGEQGGAVARSVPASASTTSAPAGSSGPPAGSASPASAQRPDVVPKLVNPTGLAACGYYTFVTEAAGTKYTNLGVAVAVHPSGSIDPVKVAMSIGGSAKTFSFTMSSAGVESGTSTSIDGGPEFPMGELGILWFDPVITDGVRALLDQPRVVTVTVDPDNQIRESNETNNSVRLQLAGVPGIPKRTTRTAPVIRYASAKCTVL